MFQFPGLPPMTYGFSHGSLNITSVGFSYSEIRVSLTACVSARLFAAYRVLRRLLAPRHSPHALLCLTLLTKVCFRVLVCSEIDFSASLSEKLIAYHLFLENLICLLLCNFQRSCVEKTVLFSQN